MFYRDVSRIPTTGCNVITSSTVITNYSNNSSYTYELIGNAYIYRSTSPSTSQPTNAVCQTNTQIQTLQSNYDYIIPLYHLSAIGSALVLFWIAYRIILKPFLGRRRI